MKNKNPQTSLNKSLDDFKVLRDVIYGKKDIKDIDIDLEKRLITLCNNRINEVNKMIIDKDLEINKIKKLISNLTNN